jgi:uncharacterized protein with von Willebrand factor type A (vWA) domain
MYNGRMAHRFRYSEWDGTQDIPPLDPDDILAGLTDDLLNFGDLQHALRNLLQRGMRNPLGQRLEGLRDLLQQLRQQRRQQLDRYNLASVFDDIQKKLDEIMTLEHDTLDRRLQEATQQIEGGERPLQAFEEAVKPSGQEQTAEEQKQLAGMLKSVAERKKNTLESLPDDAGGRIKELQNYEFMDPEAWRMFQELLQSLRQQMLKPFMQGMQQAMSNMSPQDMQRMREMIQDLNRMLRDRAEGNEPDFQAFKDKWGQNFPGVENLDQLLEQMGKQMAQMQSLMESMTPGQRRELQEMMQSLLAQDERLDAALAQLAMNLDQLMPLDEMRRRYDFKGDDPLTLREAMQLMDELAQMEKLERQLRKAQDPASLEKIDPDEVE